MTIKAITFDFWATLYQGRTVDYGERMRLMKADIEAGSGVDIDQTRFENGVKVARNAWSRAWIEEHRTMGAEEWLSIMLQYLEVSVKSEYLLKMQHRMENSILNERPIPASEATTVLADLSSRYRLGLISDTGIIPGRALRQVLADDELLGYFSHLTFSDEVGRSKPHPSTFLTTLEALQANPTEAVHIGDLLRTDIAGAQGVGMRGVQYIGLKHDKWIDQSDTSAQGLVTPDAIIRSHTELESLIQSWNGSPA